MTSFMVWVLSNQFKTTEEIILRYEVWKLIILLKLNQKTKSYKNCLYANSNIKIKKIDNLLNYITPNILHHTIVSLWDSILHFEISFF